LIGQCKFDGIYLVFFSQLQKEKETPHIAEMKALKIADSLPEPNYLSTEAIAN